MGSQTKPITFLPSSLGFLLALLFIVFPCSGGRSLADHEHEFRLSTSMAKKNASIQDLAHDVGFYKLPYDYEARMFYYFFESRNNKSDPVVLWLQGGPGCSGATALFYENGPFHISNKLSLSWSSFGWDKVSNLIYVDQPLGTGFSFVEFSRSRHEEGDISNDLYHFIQAFFKDHPQYVNNDFYIAGKDYAGHYIPPFALRIHQGNKAKQGIHINLKGMVIGDADTNPAIQYASIPDYAKDMGLITDDEYNHGLTLIPECEKSIQTCVDDDITCTMAYEDCTKVVRSVANGLDDFYDIRKNCSESNCYDYDPMLRLLNEREVQNALGIVDTYPFYVCSPMVGVMLRSDFLRSYDTSIPTLLDDGIKLLVYVGEYDFLYNWLGNSRWVHAMEWSGKDAFAASPNVSFEVDGAKAGELKSHGSLSFLKVHNAGLMVAIDQPKVALEMMQRWMHDKL